MLFEVWSLICEDLRAREVIIFPSLLKSVALALRVLFLWSLPSGEVSESVLDGMVLGEDGEVTEGGIEVSLVRKWQKKCAAHHRIVGCACVDAGSFS